MLAEGKDPTPQNQRSSSKDGSRDVRDRILDAGLAILRESGIQKLSQVQVARRAEVRQSHLTYYFPTRHDLLEEISVRFLGGVVRGLRRAADSSPDDGGEELLRTLNEAISNPEHMRMFMGVIVEADGDPELREMLVRGTLRMRTALAELLGGEDAEDRAQTILATMWGFGLYRFVMRDVAGEPGWDLLMSRLTTPDE